MNIIGQRTMHYYSASGDVSQRIDLSRYDGNAWECHALRVVVSYEAELASSLLSVDFTDPTLEQPGRKRVFRSTDGELDFVSDNLGHGWLVPRRSSNDSPMVLDIEAVGVGGAGVGESHLFVELWWERRGEFWRPKR